MSIRVSQAKRSVENSLLGEKMLSRKEASSPPVMRYSASLQGGLHADALEQNATTSACYESTGMFWESHKSCQSGFGKPKEVSIILRVRGDVEQERGW